jgi:hypothetical protein
MRPPCQTMPRRTFSSLCVGDGARGDILRWIAQARPRAPRSTTTQPSSGNRVTSTVTPPSDDLELLTDHAAIDPMYESARRGTPPAAIEGAWAAVSTQAASPDTTTIPASETWPASRRFRSRPASSGPGPRAPPLASACRHRPNGVPLPPPSSMPRPPTPVGGRDAGGVSPSEATGWRTPSYERPGRAGSLDRQPPPWRS